VLTISSAIVILANLTLQTISRIQVIARTTNPTMHKQLLRELKFLDACTSPYIVQHYGSFLTERDSQIGILMEYCEGGSLDGLVGRMKKRDMRCSEHVLGRIAASVSYAVH
jgi:mitogen-activated protein kinase kinase